MHGQGLLEVGGPVARHGSPCNLVQVWPMRPGFPITDVMDAPKPCRMATHHIRDPVAAARKSDGLPDKLPEPLHEIETKLPQWIETRKWTINGILAVLGPWALQCLRGGQQGVATPGRTKRPCGASRHFCAGLLPSEGCQVAVDAVARQHDHFLLTVLCLQTHAQSFFFAGPWQGRYPQRSSDGKLRPTNRRSMDRLRRAPAMRPSR